MRKAILIILPFFYLGACTEPAPVVVVPVTDHHHHHKKKTVRVKKSDQAEDFRAVEKPPSYTR